VEDHFTMEDQQPRNSYCWVYCVLVGWAADELDYSGWRPMSSRWRQW